MAKSSNKKSSEKDIQKDYIQVSFPDGEKELLILFTYKSEEFKKNYVFSYDEKDQEYYVFEIIDDKSLKPVQNDNELDRLDEILADYLGEQGHECSCGCDGDHCDCGGDCDCDHEHHDCGCDHDHHDGCSCGHHHKK